MASISSSPSSPKFLQTNPKFFSRASRLHFSSFRSTSSESLHSCRCQNASVSHSPYEDIVQPRWDAMLQGVVKNAVQKWNNYVNSYRSPPKKTACVDNVAEKEKKESEDWDWERWRKHFAEVEEQERIVSVLKLADDVTNLSSLSQQSQLGDAVCREDYEDAAKLKVAIAAAVRNDAVISSISFLNQAVEEERYKDAAFIRDNVGAGLVGWWAGISEDSTDPYGLIIHISAEHGRYVARSYNSWQLATATPGVPLFEIFFTMNTNAEYKEQYYTCFDWQREENGNIIVETFAKAVYLKRNRVDSGDFLTKTHNPLGITSLNPITDSTEGNSDLSGTNANDTEEGNGRDDDSDVTEGFSGIQSILRYMIPGVKVKVAEVVAPDWDLMLRALEQDSDGEDEEIDSVEPEDEIKAENDGDEIEMDAGGGINDISQDQNQMAMKVVVGGLVQKLTNNIAPKDIVRVPAWLEKRGRSSFTLSIKEEENRQKTVKKGEGSLEKTSARPGQRSIDHAISDLAKVLISRKKIPTKDSTLVHMGFTPLKSFI